MTTPSHRLKTDDLCIAAGGLSSYMNFCGFEYARPIVWSCSVRLSGGSTTIIFLCSKIDETAYGYVYLVVCFPPHERLLQEKRQTYTVLSTQHGLLTLFLVHNHTPLLVVGYVRGFLVGAW